MKLRFERLRIALIDTHKSECREGRYRRQPANLFADAAIYRVVGYERLREKGVELIAADAPEAFAVKRPLAHAIVIASHCCHCTI